MDRKEALKKIVYLLKEIDGTRMRLSTSKPETLDIEIALLNQQVINLYRDLSNYQNGLYASAPSEPISAPEPEKIYIPVKEPAPSAPETKAKAGPQEAELKKLNQDAALRKERLKRLEAEAEKAAQETPPPAPKGETEEFDQYVEEKEDARDAITGNKPVPVPAKNNSAEQTLNEKLQSGTKLPSSLNEKFSHGETKKTLADKMKLAPIGDLKAAMTLNQKIAFASDLFGGDDKEFKKALSFLNGCTNFSEAKYYLQSDIGARFSWDPENPLVDEFTELVYRKFL